MKKNLYIFAALLFLGGVLFNGCSADVAETDDTSAQTRAIGDPVNNSLWLEVAYNSTTGRHTVTIHADVEMEPYRYVLYINPLSSYNFEEFLPVEIMAGGRPIYTYSFRYMGNDLPFTAYYQVVGESLIGYRPYNPNDPDADRRIFMNMYSSLTVRYPALSNPGNPGNPGGPGAPGEGESCIWCGTPDCVCTPKILKSTGLTFAGVDGPGNYDQPGCRWCGTPECVCPLLPPVKPGKPGNPGGEGPACRWCGTPQCVCNL